MMSERGSSVDAIHYDGKIFRSMNSSENGEVTSETIFKYYQQGRIVWAEYSGGSIIKGHLMATVDDAGNLDMRYHHINDRDEIMTGQCHSRPEIMPNNKIRLHEEWQWTCKDQSQGKSIIEEL